MASNLPGFVKKTSSIDQIPIHYQVLQILRCLLFFSVFRVNFIPFHSEFTACIDSYASERNVCQSTICFSLLFPDEMYVITQLLEL